jgi:citrate synthase
VARAFRAPETQGAPGPSPHRARAPEALLQDASDWWTTEIIDVRPGQISVRGHPIEDLVGRVTFPEMIWLMLRGELPAREQAELLEAALVAAVDHGPQAPSIAIARMAVTCGVALNGAMASAINVLDDVHGGAGQQCMELYRDVAERAGRDERRLAEAVGAALDRWSAERGPMVPGFGHRFHPVDPRATRLVALVERAAAAGVVGGWFARIAAEVERTLERSKGRRLPMNIDGATAVVYAELGFEPELGRGLFVLSRSVGILAHAWEQRRQGERIKGPMPRAIPYRYAGPPRRSPPPAPGPGHEAEASGFRSRSIDLPGPGASPDEIPVDLTKRGDYEPL